MKIIDIFSNKKVSADNRPCLQQLVEFIKSGSLNKAVELLSSQKKSKKPIAIPHTPEAIAMDFFAVRQCMISEQLTENELAALLAVVMMKKHPKSISQLLSDSGYTVPSIERITYLGTYISTLQTLADFASSGVKKYRISSCGDSKTCPKCAKQNGKTHLVSKAVVGKNIPPFCEKCRCVIIAEL